MNAGSLLPLLLLAVFFYALVLRPSQRRQREAAQVSASLEPGMQIITTAGMLATVQAVQDKHVDLEIAPGVVVRFAKGAVARVEPPEVPDPSSSAEDSSSSQDEPRNTSET